MSAAPESTRVDAEPARAHLMAYLDSGAPLAWVARRTGVPFLRLQRLRDALTTDAHIAAAVLALTEPCPDDIRMANSGIQLAARRHVESLIAAGASVRWVTEGADISKGLVTALRRGDTRITVAQCHRLMVFTEVPGSAQERPAYGQAIPGVERGVPAGPIREHLERLILTGGVDDAWIAEQAAVSIKTVRRVLRGEGSSVYGGTAVQLMRLRPPAHPVVAQRVSTATLIEYLQDLKHRGFSVAYLSAKTGLGPRMLTPSYLRRGVSQDVHDKIVALWQGKQGRAATVTLQAWPVLAKALADAPQGVVAQETGVARATVARVQQGEAIHSDVADVLMAWVRDNAAGAAAYAAAA